MGRIKNRPSNDKRDLFANKLATLLLVQTKLLPSSALGIKDLSKKL